MNKGLITAIIIIIVVLVGAGAWVLMQPQNNVTNNTTNSNNTTIINVTNDTNQNTNDTTKNNTSKNITALEANKIAEKYIAMGVYLGNNTTLTTFKGVKVWNVSVYTTQGLYSDSIYISVTDGKRIQ